MANNRPAKRNRARRKINENDVMYEIFVLKCRISRSRHVLNNSKPSSEKMVATRCSLHGKVIEFYWCDLLNGSVGFQSSQS